MLSVIIDTSLTFRQLSILGIETENISHLKDSLALKRADWFEIHRIKRRKLTTEPIQSPPLPLEGVHDIHGGDGLPFGVLGVGDSITDGVVQESLQN